MGKKQPAKQQAAKAAAATAKGKAGKKQRDGGSSSSSGAGGYGSLHDPLDRQLALLGLRVKNITADGNCFFRALSDQLQGDESRHSELRGQVCGLMAERCDDFAPFVEDDLTLDAHLARMRREGVWAGHMELQAASLLLEVNIAIYQAGQPRWCITNFPTGSRMLHLSYHDGEHYNSVRRADDYSRGSPPADIPETPTPVADVAEARQCWSGADERRVAEGTGCDNPVLIRQQLDKAGGNVDAAIEAVIEIMAGDDYEAHATAATAADGDAATAGGVAGGDGGAIAGQQAAGAASKEAAASGAAGSGEEGAEPDQEAAAAAVGEADGQQQQPSSSTVSEQGPPEAAATPAAADDSSSNNADGAAAAAAAPAPSNCSTTSSKAKGVRLKTKGGSSAAAGAGGRRGADRAPSRNKPCPCGSGRKHKVCCGAKAVAPPPQEVPLYKLPKTVTWADEEGPGVLTRTLHI